MSLVSSVTRTFPFGNGGGPLVVDEESSSICKKEVPGTTLDVEAVTCSSGNSVEVVTAICKSDSSWDKLGDSPRFRPAGVWVLVFLGSRSGGVDKPSVQEEATGLLSSVSSTDYGAATWLASIRCTISVA